MIELGQRVSWIANKKSGALKHRAFGKVIEIDLEKNRARVEMKTGPGGGLKNRFYKDIKELRTENATRETQREITTRPIA